MRILKEEKLLDINGGAISSTIWYIAGAVATFVIGFFNGYTNPTSCNN